MENINISQCGIILYLFLLTIPSLTSTLKFGPPNAVSYHLTLSYFKSAPDGVPRQVLGFNQQFPGPTLRAKKGDILIFKLTNLIQNQQGTSIHFHGMEQFLSPFEDGPHMITQCDIPYGYTHTYQFLVRQSGTYWYHAHRSGQITEGAWGAFLVENTPAEVHRYDGEFLIGLTDWYHQPVDELSAWYLDTKQSKGGMPFPESLLINGKGYYPCDYAKKQNLVCNSTLKNSYRLFEVERGKTYRFRVLNAATIVLFAIMIDGHKLEVIETDGVDTVRVKGVDRITVSTGARTSFVVRMNGDQDQFWIRIWADLQPYKLTYPNINKFPEVLNDNPYVMGVLRYKRKVNGNGVSNITNNGIVQLTNSGAVQGRPDRHDVINLIHELGKVDAVSTSSFGPPPKRGKDPMNLPDATAPFPSTTIQSNPITLNHRDCIPLGREVAPAHVNQRVLINIPDIDNPSNTFKPGFNNITFSTVPLNKPGLVKFLRGERLPTSLNPITIKGFGSEYVVELIINDHSDSGHPLHLHGHTFWVMGYGVANDGPFQEERDRQKLRSGLRRETMAVQPKSWLVIRFRADNPGLWLFHCHMNFHFEASLGLVFKSGEALSRLIYRVPRKIKKLCKKSGIRI